jgi:hypothetical protein
MARFCRTPISTLHSLDLRTRLPQAENVLLLRFRAASDQCLRLRKRRVGYAFCPTCISLQPYVHVRWDWAFPALLRCHVHKSPLRRGCPMCGEDDPLPFAAPALASILCWSCGAHLTGASLGSHVGHVNGTYAVVERVYRVALRGTSPDYALMGEATGTQFRRFVDDLLQLLAWYPSPELSPRSTDPQNHHRLLVNIETSAMRMQKFHRSSSAPLAWSPDRRNLESVLRGGKPPVATIRGAQGVPGPTVTRADAHQSHTDLYARDAKTLYTNTLARFIYRGSETPVGDCYETFLHERRSYRWRYFRVAHNHRERHKAPCRGLDERLGLIWSDPVNTAKSVGIFL